MLELLNKAQREEITQQSLDALVQKSARTMLEEALQAEVREYIQRHKDEQGSDGNRAVVRNGYAKSRKIQTISGTIEVKSPRVNDARENSKFVSKLLPPYLRRSPEVESLIPSLYLSGVSTGKFGAIFKEYFGKGLSPATVVKLKRKWEEEFKLFKSSPITEEIVYMWADGVHLKIRLGDQKSLALLVVIGVTVEGKKVVLAVEPGYRESVESWEVVLRSLQERGMSCPLVAVADGATGFWTALRKLEHYKDTMEQRCWVHKMKNVLDKCPKSLQPNVKHYLNEMMMAPDEETSTKVKDNFVRAFKDKYPKMTDCIQKDWGELITFYSLPAASWAALRTTNPIESAFSSVKLRMKVQRGSGSISAAGAMAFKLLKQCEKSWRKIKGFEEITNLLKGVKYKDGVALNKGQLEQQKVA